MKNFKSTLLGAVIVLATGCVNYSTPEGAVGTAGGAIRKNDVATFRNSLTQEYAQVAGNAATLNKLKADLSNYTNVTITNEYAHVQWTPGTDGSGRYNDSWRSYLEILSGTDANGNRGEIYNVYVACSIYPQKQLNKVSADLYPKQDPNGRPVYEEVRDCRISSIQKL